MNIPLISFIIITRNRVNRRLYNCLASIRNQSVPASAVEILLLDYGSDRSTRMHLSALAKRFQARHEHVEEHGPWNRARAINLGCQRAKGAVLAVSDIDMVFAPNYARTALDCFERSGCGAFYARATPYNSPQGEYDEQDVTRGFVRLLRSSTARPTGKGNVIFSRAMFESLRGWEEGYEVYGCEDDDFYDRSRRHGAFYELDGETSLVHQWHEVSWTSRDVYRGFGANQFLLYSSADRIPVRRTGMCGDEPALDVHAPFERPTLTLAILPVDGDQGIDATLKSVAAFKYDRIRVVVAGGTKPTADIEDLLGYPLVWLPASSVDEGVEKLKELEQTDVLGLVGAGSEFGQESMVHQVLVPLASQGRAGIEGFFWWGAAGYDPARRIVLRNGGSHGVRVA